MAASADLSEGRGVSWTTPHLLHLMAASGQLGYGIPAPAFEQALAEQPDVIGADMGSIDPGPYYLGTGQLAAGLHGVLHDLRMILGAALAADVPALIGNAGTAGRTDQLERVRDLAEQILVGMGRCCRVACLETEVSRDVVLDKLARGRVTPMVGVPTLTPDAVEQTEVIVAQVGPERWAELLRAHAQVGLVGRTLDTAIFSAVALERGFERGLATHAGKLLECSSLAATPPGRDAAIAVLAEDSFEFHSCGSGRTCTPRSVAAHAFYEQSDPSRINEPGGYVDLSSVTYEQSTGGIVRVRGSRWVEELPYRVKIEGARKIGWRAICIAGVTDPKVLAERTHIEAEVAKAVERIDSPGQVPPRWRLIWGGSVESIESDPVVTFPAIVLLEVVAGSQDEAVSLCGAAKQYLLHTDYPGLLNNGGNVAFPFSPEVISVGAAYEFSVYHLMELDDVEEVGAVTEHVLGHEDLATRGKS